MPALTVESVARVISATPATKAAGHDQWRYDEIKAWPVDMPLVLTNFYTGVEHAGKWPACLSSCLPKCMSGLADDDRPIMLLSTLFSELGLRSRGECMQKRWRVCCILAGGSAVAAEG